MLYLRHKNLKSVLSYYLCVNYYFDSDVQDDYDFITMNVKASDCTGLESGVYMIPIHKTKCVESGFTEHIYYNDAVELKPYKIIKDGLERFHCESCGRLAKILKKEWWRPKTSKECKSCYFDMRK